MGICLSANKASVIEMADLEVETLEETDSALAELDWLAKSVKENDPALTELK